MAANNDQKWFDIFRKIRSNQEPTEAELKFYIENLPSVDEARLKELVDKQNSTEDGKKMPLSQTEATELLTLMGQKALTLPSTKQLYLDKAKEIEKTNLGNKIAQGVSLALAGADIVSSTQQVKTARQLARQSRRPQQAAPLTQDPLLKQAIFEAQQGQFDTAKRLAPAQLAILDQYLSDINQARTASTGQAGTYGSLAQVASTRRGRNLQQLTPMADDIRAREQGRLDNLLQMRLGENQAIQQSQAQYYPTDVNAYLQEQQAIGQLGATGQQNLRGSLANLGGQIVQPVADAATRRKYDRLRALLPENAYNYRLEAENNVSNAWNGGDAFNRMQIDPTTGQPIYTMTS